MRSKINTKTRNNKETKIKKERLEKYCSNRGVKNRMVEIDGLKYAGPRIWVQKIRSNLQILKDGSE